MTELNHSDVPSTRREALLPEIIRLTREGQTSRQIAAKLKVPKSNIGRWLRQARQEAAKEEAFDPADALRKDIEFHLAVRDEMQAAWRRSQKDKQVRVEEQSGPVNDPGAAKMKKSVRTESQTGVAGYLTQAMTAHNKAMARKRRLAALVGGADADCGSPADLLANLSDDDLEKLTPDDFVNFNDEQLYAIRVRLRARDERNGGKFAEPVLTNEQIRGMSDEELARQIAAHVAAVGED